MELSKFDMFILENQYINMKGYDDIEFVSSRLQLTAKGRILLTH